MQNKWVTGFLLFFWIAQIEAKSQLFKASESLLQARLEFERSAVVTVTANDLQSFSGKAVNEYSIMVLKQGRWVPIPFQIDEVDTEGHPVAAVGDMSATSMKGTPDVFDAGDQLLLMLRDMTQEQWLAPSEDTDSPIIMAEFLVHTGLGKRYAYLVLSDSRRSHKDYVHYDQDTFFVETDYYMLASDLDNPLVWQDLLFVYDKGEKLTTVLDTMKVRLSGKTLGGASSILFTNENLKSRIVGVKNGPVRAVVDIETDILVAKMPVMSVLVQLQFFSQHMVGVTYSHAPRWVSWVFKNPSIAVSLDAHELYGSTVTTAFSSENAGIVDGQLSASELLMIEQGVDRENAWWLLKRSSKTPKFRMFASLFVPENFDTDVSIIYQDDAKLKINPERFLGQLPNLGFKIENLPVTQAYYMAFHLHLGVTESEINPHAFAEVFHQKEQEIKPRIKVM